MSQQEPNRVNLRYATTIGVFLFASALVAGSLTFAQSDETADMSNLETALRDLRSSEARVRDKAVDTVLQSRTELVEDLIALAQVDKELDTRVAAAYLLGELRAPEAVPILSQILIEERTGVVQDYSRYDAPAFSALVKIGRPSVPTMIENIQTSENQLRVRRSLDVLIHVLGGKAHLLELLEKLKLRAGDDAGLVGRLTDAIEYAQEHYQYKETEPPLY